MRLRESREEPDRECAGIGSRLVGIERETLDGVGEAGSGTQVQLVMLRAVITGDLAGVLAVVERAAAEPDGKSLEAAREILGRVVHDGGGIQSAAGPDAQRNVGDQMLADGSTQQVIELFRGFIEGAARLRIEAEAPPGARGDLAGAPLQQMAGREFFNALY